jgi:UDP-2,3-diacylglucosamine hydrolase
MLKHYFASDFHLGADSLFPSEQREKRIVAWLEDISHDAAAVYLVGDIFDFWFEYNKVVPKGFTRILGKLGELTDRGIPIYFFPGNHDMWVSDYLPKEIGLKIIKEPLLLNLEGKRLYISHGDGMGPGDYSYKLLKKIFASPLSQFLFAALHPRWGMGIAHAWSKRSRAVQGNTEEFLGKEKEWLYRYCEDFLEIDPSIDYFIFGHRHLPLDLVLSNGKSKYFNLGEWLTQQTYGVFTNGEFQLKVFGDTSAKIIRCL